MKTILLAICLLITSQCFAHGRGGGGGYHGGGYGGYHGSAYLGHGYNRAYWDHLQYGGGTTYYGPSYYGETYPYSQPDDDNYYFDSNGNTVYEND